MSETNLPNPYLEDLLHQPDALENTLAEFEKLNLESFSLLGEQVRSGRLQRVVLTGMGSSFHALHPLLLGLLAEGLPARMLETSELIHHAPALLTRETLLVAVSQSGLSAEVVQLLEKVPAGAPVIGITNTPDSPLASRAGSLLLTKAGEESSVSCKTYVATLAALALLEPLLSGRDVDQRMTELHSLPQAVNIYLSRLEPYVNSLEESLKGITYLVFTGRGASLAAVGTGGLIIKEAAHFPAEGMSSASFRHGPIEMVSPATFVLVYEGSPPTQALNRSLLNDIMKLNGRGALVETSSAPYVFHLPKVPPSCLPVMEILPAQMLSLALARLNHHIAGQFSHGSKVTRFE